ncbi:MAG: hypothetical protein SFX73_26290 [Kofleriaceae bacterium]|nr:hypothetical protein [Kofleriaceae bacterium]
MCSALLSITTLAACAAEGFPGDEVEDVEVVDDGKGDGWATDMPQGTYSVEDAATGDVAKLTLNANKTFRRELKGKPALEGKFKITQGGGNRYIRFLKNSGTLIDRYGFEIHGRQLLVRKVGETDWQALVAEDNFKGVNSAYAGTYTAYGRGDLPEGGIFELMLHDTGRFHMTVEAVHACNAPGHGCSSSWSDGWTGSSYIYGTWAPKQGGGGVSLTPRNDATGQVGWKFDLAMIRTGDHLDVTGKDGSLQLTGSMDVQALFAGAHSVTDAAVDGTWKVAKVGSDPDATVSLWGFSLVLNGAEHQATFDAETNEFCELSPNTNNAPKCGVYQIANDPKGGTRGVIYGYRGTEFAALRITTKTASKMTLTSDEGTVFTLMKQ